MAELAAPPVKPPFKLVVGASAGGHANELLILLGAARGLWPAEPATYVTTMQLAAEGFKQFRAARARHR